LSQLAGFKSRLVVSVHKLSESDQPFDPNTFFRRSRDSDVGRPQFVTERTAVAGFYNLTPKRMSIMTGADPKDLPQQRLIQYLEMATKAHEAARNPSADLQVRNLYAWVAKSWEMLAMDELDKMRTESGRERSRQRQVRSVPTRSRNGIAGPLAQVSPLL
jgi:hypothetical protein